MSALGIEKRIIRSEPQSLIQFGDRIPILVSMIESVRQRFVQAEVVWRRLQRGAIFSLSFVKLMELLISGGAHHMRRRVNPDDLLSFGNLFKRSARMSQLQVGESRTQQRASVFRLQL